MLYINTDTNYCIMQPRYYQFAQYTNYRWHVTIFVFQYWPGARIINNGDAALLGKVSRVCYEWSRAFVYVDCCASKIIFWNGQAFTSSLTNYRISPYTFESFQKSGCYCVQATKLTAQKFPRRLPYLATQHAKHRARNRPVIRHQ